MERKKRPRRTPFLEAARAYPLDLLLWCNEAVASVDWNELVVPVAVPGGFGASILFTLLCKWSARSIDKRNRNALFQTDTYSYERLKHRALTRDPASLKMSSFTSFWLGLTQVSLIALFCCSLANAIHVFFFSCRSYTLLYTSTRPSSPSAREQELSLAPSFWSYLTLFFSLADDESFYDDSINTTRLLGTDANLFDKHVFELVVWDPSKFQLFFLSSCNPLVLLLVWMISDVSILKLAAIIAMLDAQLYFVFHKFFVLLNDKQIVFQEMFLEYNNKFVKPKTDILKRDVVIDATMGPRAPVSLQVHNHTNPFFQNTKLKVFITHDINGKPYNSLNLDDTGDQLEYERHKLEEEKLRLELERAKLQTINSTFNSSIANSTIDEHWFSQSTPQRSRGPLFDRNVRLPAVRSAMSPPSFTLSRRSVSPRRNQSWDNDRSRDILRSPGRSPFRSPTRLGSHSPEKTGFSRSELREKPSRKELKERYTLSPTHRR